MASESRPSYTVLDALQGLSEDVMRRKGGQQGTVRNRGGRWYITFRAWQPDDKGNLEWRQVQRLVEGAKSRRQAQLMGFEMYVGPANATCKVPQGIATVQQFVETRFIPDRVSRLKKSTRVGDYETRLKNHVLPSLGAVQMRDVTPQMVQQLIQAKLDAGLSVGTVGHIKKLISAIFRHARNLRFYEGMLPTEGVRMPQNVPAERRALTIEQVRMLTAKMPLKHRALVTVLAQTGLRIGEACGLRWRSVNLSEDWAGPLPPRSLQVSEAFVRGERTSPKSGHSRIVPLTREAIEALQSHLLISPYREPEHPVFASRVGTPLDAHNVSQRSLKTAARKLGIPWATFHCLRHTAATLADRAGLTVAEKQKVLGHSTAAMSAHYTHPEIDGVRAKLERVN